MDRRPLQISYSKNQPKKDFMTKPQITIEVPMSPEALKDLPLKIQALMKCQEIDTVQGVLESMNQHPLSSFSLFKSEKNYWVFVGIKPLIEEMIRVIKSLSNQNIAAPAIVGCDSLPKSKACYRLIVRVPENLQVINNLDSLPKESESEYIKLVKGFQNENISYPFDVETLLWNKDDNSFFPGALWLAKKEND